MQPFCTKYLMKNLAKKHKAETGRKPCLLVNPALMRSSEKREAIKMATKKTQVIISKDVLKAAIALCKGEENIRVAEYKDNLYVTEGHVLIRMDKQDIDQLLIALKIVPQGIGRYSYYGKKWIYSEDTISVEIIIGDGVPSNTAELTPYGYSNGTGVYRLAFAAGRIALFQEKFARLIETVFDAYGGNLRSNGNGTFYVLGCKDALELMVLGCHVSEGDKTNLSTLAEKITEGLRLMEEDKPKIM